MKYKTGEKPGAGNYRCTNCGNIITLKSDDEALPICPVCQNQEFEKVS